MDENSWIDRAQHGDAAAFANLVERYQGRLVAFLWNLLGCGDDARDAAQDAFVQAYQGLGHFDGSRPFKNWLFAIAYNRGIDLLRRKQRFHRFWEREAAAGAPATRPTAGLEESPLWRPALRRLTAQERSVLALAYNEGWAAAEIGAILGCSESTVRVHLLNSRRKLKKELQAAGFNASLKKASAGEAP